MNKRAILHIPQSQYAFPSTEKIMTIRLRAAGDDLTSCTLYYGDRACCETPVRFYPLPMAVAAKDELFEYYEVTFESPFNRLCYYFKIEKKDEWTYYYGDQFSSELPDILFNGTMIEGRSEYYQYPFILRGEIPDVPEWFKNAVVYNIFPDSFANGKQMLISQEKQILTDTGHPSKAKLGGTMKGITESLSYIKDLGFTCIYLNPIFMAGEYHKYDILDYYRIDPCFGNEEDFRELVEKVHENHMHIIIDGVFNHCGWYFFAFEDVIKNGEASKYRDWFYDLKFPVSRPEQGALPTYACFAYEGKMPKLNTSNKVVAQYFADVCKYWIRSFGIDGWRLDVANEIDRDFWRSFKKAAKEENKDIVLIGEVWENADIWLRGDIFDSTMNYDFRKHCRDFFALGKIDAFSFGAHISQMLLRYPLNITLGQLNLLDTHDVSRFLSLCNGNIKRWKLAFIALMLLPGVPSLFYGDEKKITGLKEADYRSPMPWQSEDKELENFIRFIIDLRKNYIDTTSEYQVMPVQKGSYLYSFYRTNNRARLLVIMNAGDAAVEFELPAFSQLLTAEGFRLRESDSAEIQAMGYGICLINN